MITMLFKKPLFFFFLACLSVTSAIHGYGGSSTVVRKDERQILVSTEFGQISAVNVSDGIGRQYHLQFITLEPNALFLPVLLHADMVFYVHTGSGSLSWLDAVETDNTKSLDLERGDVYGLSAGSIFYLQSSLEPERQKLRIYAMFVNSNEAAFQESILPMGTYSSIRDLLLGFDKKVLQSAFQVSAEAIEELMSSERQPPIVHAVVSKREEKEKKKKKKKNGGKQIESRFMESVMGSRSYRMLFDLNEDTLNKKEKEKGKGKKKKTSTFNFMNAKPDFQNCNGWSLAVTNKNLQALMSPDVGLFMVNLTRGSMMGPHWNPMAMELGIVTHGQGMILSVPSSHGEIKSVRVKVEEGDVFVVPRFHMMAQLAFNNDSFVFMGFSTTSKMNHPQYVAGKASVLQVLDRKVLAMSFNVRNSTMDQILNPAVESIILECVTCAEEEERIMNEEIQKEEARKKEEEEEAARKREEEEEEARKREEEEEEEEEEEMRKKEEEEARKRKEEEEEARKREEEEEMRKKEEEARKRKEEEEEARKREEEEEAKKREEEEMRKREEEEEARKRKEEEEAARRREEEEEEEAKREEEEAKKREEEEEEMRKREEEEARKRKEEEEAARRREEEEEEEEAKWEEEEARKREKEQEEAERRKEEEAQRRKEEEEEAKWEEEEARKREKEQEEAERKKEEEEEARKSEEEAERRKEEEKEARKREEDEEAIRRREEEGEKAKREKEEEEEEEEARKREAKQEQEKEWKEEGETA